jgi:hypothetical protein
MDGDWIGPYFIAVHNTYATSSVCAAARSPPVCITSEDASLRVDIVLHTTSTIGHCSYETHTQLNIDINIMETDACSAMNYIKSTDNQRIESYP